MFSSSSVGMGILAASISPSGLDSITKGACPCLARTILLAHFASHPQPRRLHFSSPSTSSKKLLSSRKCSEEAMLRMYTLTSNVLYERTTLLVRHALDHLTLPRTHVCQWRIDHETQHCEILSSLYPRQGPTFEKEG
eukprot:gnl/MRDRNA2_/MRDRNA2_366428_c0_seq1.p1 gnl/MRDRNA2_/MRDRNA2_366428_c0~~gnl/MRDRNA2_/MRDRNA2_366428_c0_seq1.p1  ORF type:complete len:137 (+),score=2.43 gnl/MRDRNA2_/MRDRNA2_366428_c0_seq1:47-457(+)